MQIMTKEQAEAYRAKFAKDTAKWCGEAFQHFDTPEGLERHLDEVKESQEVHKTPF